MPQLGFRMSAMTLRRFWTMLAHSHGQVWNHAEFARSFGVSEMTVRRYLEALASAMVVRLLPPWHENISKRQVRAPRVYVADTGLLHTLLGIETFEDLLGHPKVGASWEGLAIEEIVRKVGAAPEQRWFWATHGGAEVKRTSMPRVTPSMRVAQRDLKLDELFVIHAGRDAFPLAPGIRAIPLHKLDDELP
jgi:predicted AAA+ superfamily ATPase